MGVRKPAVLVMLLLGGLLTAGCDDDGAAAGEPGAASTSAQPTAAVNGVERLTAQEILDRAGQASLAAGSVRMRGGFGKGGLQFRMDVRSSAPDRAMGEVTFGDNSLHLVRIGRTVYMKADDAFWRELGGRAVVDMMSGKYLKATIDDTNLRKLKAFTDHRELLGDALRSTGALTKGTTAMVGWNSVITLKGGDIGNIYVSTVGQPYVLQLEGTEKERLDFSDYGVPVSITPPPPNTVIDADVFKKLGGDIDRFPVEI
ncbi:hypothetical protein SAMN04489712_11018 [Thermomonospora echinospora]|uniref:Lipoprotein LprG n=1 Tax=Thermomonospora echinospora TaxID=1992 RepID=A0A1H6CIN6_9ACTN|nr:hypothetical protein [Thermomonospora echinospora]SEG72603.1 hypothetical protein SAMN04489712_11018 [Thermomonospora echinospora]